MNTLFRSVDNVYGALIRWERVHQTNSICLVLTFLPYYASPIFATLLSILPLKLPPTLKFLYPYIKARANPPRHVIVYTATHDTAFLARLNSRVLEVSKSGHHFPALLSFWASLITEVVGIMIDQSRSGRQEAQIQKQEDLMYHIIPTLNEGLTLKNVPDLQVGCYMIFTVLAMKASLNDKALAEAMNKVALNWSQTKEAGIVCISALATSRGLLPLPKRVFRSFLAINRLVETLVTLKSQYRLDSIALGILLRIFRDYEALDFSRLDLVRSLIKADLMSNSYITCAIAALILVTRNPHQNVHIRSSIEHLLFNLAEDKNVRHFLKDAANGINMDLTYLEPGFQKNTPANRNDYLLSKVDLDHEEDMLSPIIEPFDDAVSNISTRTISENSFLSESDSCDFDDLAHIFMLASSSSKTVKLFSELAILRKPFSLTEPLFLSFFIRFWCGTYPARYRAAAINHVSMHIKDEVQAEDVQVILPYILYALTDPSPKVRHVSTTLVRLLSIIYKGVDTKNHHVTPRNFGREQIYGRTKPTSNLTWLSGEEAATFTEEILLPGLEECLLDPRHISQRLLDTFIGPRHPMSSQANRKELKTSLRQKIFIFICSHAVKTPLYAVKLRLLQILNQVEKVGNTSRTKPLLPLVSGCIDWNPEKFERICSSEQINPSEFLHQIFRIAMPTDRNSVQILLRIVESKSLAHTILQAAAYQRIRSLWGSMKPDLQSSLAKAILELAVSEQYVIIGERRYNEALDTLQRVPLSTAILQSFLDSYATFSSDLHETALASKRRRTSRGFSVTSVGENLEDSVLAMRKLRLVLELVETCKAEQHPQLMKGLFQVLVQLQLISNDSAMDMGYLQVLTMESILSIVKEYKVCSASQTLIFQGPESKRGVEITQHANGSIGCTT